MNNFIKKLREKGLKKKIDQFVDTFGAKIDTNIEELNQNNKQKVLNDRKIYKKLVELLSKKYILPEKDVDCVKVFSCLKQDKLEDAIKNMIHIDASTFLNKLPHYNFNNMYNNLSFTYKDKLINKYKDLQNEAKLCLEGKKFIGSIYPDILNTCTMSFNGKVVSNIPNGLNYHGEPNYALCSIDPSLLTPATIEIMTQDILTQYQEKFSERYKLI